LVHLVYEMEKRLLKNLLHGIGEIHVALRDFGMRFAGRTKQLLHLVGEMSRQTYRSVRQHLHSLAASERLEVAHVELKVAVLDPYNLPDFIDVCVFSVRCEAHDLALVAIFSVPDKVADHGVETAQRIRQEHTIQNLNIWPLTARHHRRDKISRAVIAETRRPFPRRAIISTGDVSDVMLEVMFLELQHCGIHMEGMSQQ